ncbi:putative CD83 antigen, partial [Triplophysa rosa]
IMRKTCTYIILLLVHISVSVEEEQQWIKIPCQANVEQDIQYRKVTWYKVEEGSDVLTGLVLKDLNKNITILFKLASHSYVVGEDNSLQFSRTAREDCGIYRCTLWPPLGHYIQEKDYKYYSADCMKPQIQPVLSSRNDVPVMNHVKFFAVPVVMVCAFVMLFVHMTMRNRAKEKAKTLVKTNENI